MRRMLCLVGFVGMVACDLPASTAVSDDSGDTGLTTQDTGLVEPWADMATQVGSEGIFGCLVDSIVPIEGDAVPDGFTQTPNALYDALAGLWTGDFLAVEDGPLSATIDLQAPEVFRRVVVVPATGCSDYIQVETDAKIAAIPTFDETAGGVVGIRVDSARARFTLPYDQVVGSAIPQSFSVSETDQTTLRFNFELGASNITGDASFQGCTADSCVDDPSLGSFALTR